MFHNIPLCRVLAEAWHESGELRSWLAQESAWLDGLERRLRPRRDPSAGEERAPADAEEIAAELYVRYPKNNACLTLVDVYHEYVLL